MSLLDDIIEAATDEKVPIGTLLRKSLVLEQRVKNEKFKAWLNQELDGYDREADLPVYRVFNCVNKGLFVGVTIRLNDQPIPIHIMEEKDRKFVERVLLHQPAASYDGRPDKSTDATLPWNPSLTVKYQTKFFTDKDLVLNRAWQEIPGSVLVGLLEQIRSRVLRFALELKDNLPSAVSDAKDVPASVIERSVVNNIYGGNILIASRAENVNQVAHTNVVAGDLNGLLDAVKQLGVSQEGLQQLKSDIESDKKDGEQTIGPKIKGWIAGIGKYLGKETAKMPIEIAKKLAIKWIMQHYGLDAD